MAKSVLHYFVNGEEMTKKEFVEKINENSHKVIDSIAGFGISITDTKKANSIYNWCYRHIGSSYIICYDNYSHTSCNRMVSFRITRERGK